jgi:hypothetical protein
MVVRLVATQLLTRHMCSYAVPPAAMCKPSKIAPGSCCLHAQSAFSVRAVAGTMQAELMDTRCVTLPGGKKSWKIIKPQDTVVTDQQVFVRMALKDTSLSQLVFEKLEGVPREFANLACSRGLADLIQLRNAAQARLLEPAAAGARLLFDQVGPQPKMRRQSRHAIKMARCEARDSVSIEFNIGDQLCQVEVLKPVHPNDNLFVEYEPTALWQVLTYIRNSGFSDEVRKFSKRESLPKGVFRRGDAFLVRSKRADGKHRYTTCKDLETAMLELEKIQSGTADADDDETPPELRAEIDDDQANDQGPGDVEAQDASEASLAEDDRSDESEESRSKAD